MRAPRLLGVVGFCLGALSPLARADFYTGFEPPKYEPGIVQGQHGWMGNAEVVTAPHPVIQTQSLKQDKGALRQVDPPIDVTRVEWHWYFDGNTYVPAGPSQLFGTSVFALARRGDSHLWFDSGHGGIDLGFDMPWDRWVPFRVEINPATYDAMLYMDGVPIYGFEAELGNQVVALIAGGANGFENTMYLDEIRLVPEPAGILLAAVGAVAACRRR
ncbi:MAG: hypothetical protein AB1601_02070 [Planctomycetota bacterium]